MTSPLILPSATVTGFKYPTIPEPGQTNDELVATVRALKEATELLMGVRGAPVAKAVNTGEVATLLGASPSDVTSALDGDFSILDAAADRIHTQLTSDIASTKAEIQNAYAQADASLQAAVDEAKAWITDPNYARGDKFTVINGRVNTVESSITDPNAGGILARITDVDYTRVDKFQALALRSTHLESRVGIDSADNLTGTGVIAQITDTNYTRADKFNALAGRSSRLESSVGIDSAGNLTGGGLTASITDTDYTRTDKFKALAGRSSTLESRVGIDSSGATTGGGVLAAINDTDYTRADKFQALSVRSSHLESSVGIDVNGNPTGSGIIAQITDTNYTRADKFQAVAGRLHTMEAKIGVTTDGAIPTYAVLTDENYTNATLFGALTGRINTAVAQSSAGTASGYYRLLAVSATMSGVAAEFAAQVSANGTTFASAGMRLQVLGTGQSRVLFEASQFIVDVGGYTPFVISGGNVMWGGTIHGNSIIANTINGNRITAGTITATQVGANEIITDSANIGTAKIKTLHLEDSAVTVPLFKSLTADLNFSGPNWVTILNDDLIFTTVSGSTVAIQFNCIVLLTNATAGDTICDVKVTIGGVQSDSVSFGMVGLNHFTRLPMIALAQVTGTGASQTVNVKLEARVSSGFTATANTTSRFLAIAYKK